MLDRHAIACPAEGGAIHERRCATDGRDPAYVQRIATEPAIEQADDAEARRRRAVGRPPVPEPTRLRLRDLIAAAPGAPASAKKKVAPAGAPSTLGLYIRRHYPAARAAPQHCQRRLRMSHFHRLKCPTWG
jgi:hypothetical protein